MSENARVIFQPTNQFCIPEMPSVKLFRPTKEKERNEVQVVKENLGGSEGVGMKKWPSHCRRNRPLLIYQNSAWQRGLEDTNKEQ